MFLYFILTIWTKACLLSLTHGFTTLHIPLQKNTCMYNDIHMQCVHASHTHTHSPWNQINGATVSPGWKELQGVKLVSWGTAPVNTVNQSLVCLAQQWWGRRSRGHRWLSAYPLLAICEGRKITLFDFWLFSQQCGRLGNDLRHCLMHLSDLLLSKRRKRTHLSMNGVIKCC